MREFFCVRYSAVANEIGHMDSLVRFYRYRPKVTMDAVVAFDRFW